MIRKVSKFLGFLLFAFVTLLKVDVLAQFTSDGMNLDFSLGTFQGWTGWTGNNGIALGRGNPNFVDLGGLEGGYWKNPPWTGVKNFWRPEDDPSEVMGESNYPSPPGIFRKEYMFQINSDTNEYDPILIKTAVLGIDMNNGKPKPGKEIKLKKIPTHLGYSSSVRLNAPIGDCHCDMLTYDLDVYAYNSLLTFNYALVIQVPPNDHKFFNDPFFQIEVVKIPKSNELDSARVKPCAVFEALGDANPMPEGFKTYQPYKIGVDNNGNGMWQDWKQVSINLNEFIGEKVRIKVAFAGCAQSGHYSYGYFAAKAGPNSLSVDGCGDSDIMATIIAPTGFEKYEWYANPSGGSSELDLMEATKGPLLYSSNTDNKFTVLTQQYQKSKDYVVKLTSPKVSLDKNRPNCLAYVGASVKSTKPTADFEINDSLKCKQTYIFRNNTTFGENDPLGGTVEYEWDFGDGNTLYWHSSNTDTTNRNPIYKYNKAGLYKVKLSSKFNGCESIKEIELNVPHVPLIEPKDTTICQGTSATLLARTDIDDAVFVWYQDTNKVFEGNPYVVTLSEETVYTVEVSSQRTECKNREFVTVSVQLFPEITINGATKVCLGNTVKLEAFDATGATREMQWTFNKPSMPPVFNPTDPISPIPLLEFTPTKNTTVYLLAKTSVGCMTSSSVDVTLTEPIAWSSKYKICPGESVVLTGEKAETFSWTSSPKDNTLVEDVKSPDPVTVTPLGTTVYTMRGYGQAINNDTCFTERMVKITVIPYPIAEISYTPSFIDLDNPVVSFKDISKYGVTTQWDISDGTKSTSRTLNHKFNDLSNSEVEINLTTYNELGCQDTTSLVLPIDVFSVWTPNTFLPNSNTQNDKFFFHSSSRLEEVRLEVFNRWGKKLYSFYRKSMDCSLEPNMQDSYGWDGKDEGKDVPNGTYVYRLTYMKPGNPRVYDKSGTVNIIR